MSSKPTLETTERRNNYIFQWIFWEKRETKINYKDHLYSESLSVKLISVHARLDRWIGRRAKRNSITLSSIRRQELALASLDDENTSFSIKKISRLQNTKRILA